MGATGFSFAIPALPAAAGLLPLAARIAALDESDALAVEDTVVRLTFAAATAASCRKPDSATISARDEKRIASTMRYIDDHTTEAIDLDRLAAIAALSKFHFLCVFARVAGVSPYRYLINVRLRRAAVEIATRRSVGFRKSRMKPNSAIFRPSTRNFGLSSARARARGVAVRIYLRAPSRRGL